MWHTDGLAFCSPRRLACRGDFASFGEERIQVVTTTPDRRSLVEAVGGPRINGVSLVAASADAEDYQSRPHDVLRPENARIVVRVGLDYDLWLDRLLARAGRPEIARGGAGYLDAWFGVSVVKLRGMRVGPGDGHADGSGWRDGH